MGPTDIQLSPIVYQIWLPGQLPADFRFPLTGLYGIAGMRFFAQSLRHGDLFFLDQGQFVIQAWKAVEGRSNLIASGMFELISGGLGEPLIKLRVVQEEGQFAAGTTTGLISTLLKATLATLSMKEMLRGPREENR